ncbi:1,2-epoxyphenylacetyl-CoA isomerase [compost metagenome]
MQVLGLRKAMELALLGDKIDAAQALQLGLVNQVVAADSLEAEAQALVQRLAQGPTLALGTMKKLLRGAAQRTLDEQLDAEAAGFVACTKTQDFREGTDAFAEKRAARFQGR